MSPLQQRVYDHARKYGGEAYAGFTMKLILTSPDDRLIKALSAFVPDTITKALDPPKAYSKETDPQ